MAEVKNVSPALRQHISWQNPGAEVEGIVRLVHRQLQLDKDLPLGSVYVAVPNKARMAAVKEALARQRITAFTPKQLEELRGTDKLALATVDFGGGVCLGSYGSIVRMHAEHLFCTGLVEGLYPVGTEDEATRAAEARVLIDALAKVPGTVVFSSFKRALPEEAATLHLPGLRQRREHGMQVVCVSPSVFIAELGDDAPALVSGEQFMTMLFE